MQFHLSQIYIEFCPQEQEANNSRVISHMGISFILDPYSKDIYVTKEFTMNLF